MIVAQFPIVDDSFKKFMNLQQEIQKKIADELNTNLKNHLKVCLKTMGFDFDFCKDRLHMTIQGDIHKIYLDYEDEKTFVCGYIFKLNPISEKDNTFNITTTTQFF